MQILYLASQTRSSKVEGNSSKREHDSMNQKNLNGWTEELNWEQAFYQLQQNPSQHHVSMVARMLKPRITVFPNTI